MTITHAWTISSLEVVPSEDGLVDVIKAAHWRYRATDNTDGTTAESYGSHSFSEPEPASYTPFDEVTLADVTGWIEDLIGEDGMETMNTGLANQIENIRTPPVVTRMPPWIEP